MSGDRRLHVVLAAVALVTAAWCALGTGVRATYGAQTTADEPHYLMSALSLGEDLDLDVSDERAAGRYRAWHEIGLPEQDKVLDDGRRVSPHDPLLSVLLAAPVTLGGWVAAKLSLAALAGALAAAMVWVAVRRLGVPVPVAVLAVGAFALAAPLSVYGTQVYPELPAALAVTVAVGALTGGSSARRAERPFSVGAPPAVGEDPTGNGWRTVVLGLAVTALPWLSVKYAPVAAALALVGVADLLRRGERRLAAALVAGLAVAGVIFLVAHLVIYGGPTPYAAGSHFTDGELTVMGTSPDYAGRSRRLVALLADREYGLLAWHPGWLLALPALGALARRRPPGAAALALPLAAGWLNASFVALTMHGWWWPGRQVVVVLPCAVLAVAWWAGRVPRVRPWLAVAAVTGAATYLHVVVEGLQRRLTWVVDFGATRSPVHRLVRPLLPDGFTPTAADDALLAAWLVAVAALAVLGWRSAGAVASDRHEDAGAGEGPDPDVAVVDAHGHGAVG